LGYNLNFVPTPKNVNKKQLSEDIKTFNRRIKLRDHFGEAPKTDLYFKSTSTWEPSDTHHTVKTFIEDFQRKVNTTLEQTNTVAKNHHNNLSKNEMKALDELKSRDDIIITKADKGGAVVVQDVESYIKEADRQLSDGTFYKKLIHNPTSENAALVENAIDNLKIRGLLEEKLANRLKPENPRTPKLYLLPKIHKPNNPGRPVVSSVGCHTEKISAYVDHNLQPINQKLPSYIKDTTDFINKVENLPEDPREETILVTMDVRSLYTNIPNDEGIEAVKSAFRTRSAPGDGILSKVICTFLTLILTLNNFVFNDQNYVQVNGASMGTKCAPTYASIFMGWFESQHIIPRIRSHALLYVRYIDDLFIVWKGTETELRRFLEEINTVHPSIKFDHEYSRKNVNFLDTTVRVIGKKFATSLYSKPTDRRAYLHSKSYHPDKTKRSIAYSQATRLRRICTDISDFWLHADKLKTDLTNRGYDPNALSREIERAANCDRASLLTYKDKPPMSRIPLIVTYNEKLPDLKKIINDTWSHMEINPEVKAKFPEKPMIAYKRNSNLRDILGQTRVSRGRVARSKTVSKGRCTPCNGRVDAKCCKHVVSTNFFTDITGQKKYEIRHRTNCRSKNAIYLGWCNKCNNKQYVGKLEEQGANKRINKHRNDVKRADGISIDRHFDQPDHDFDRDFQMIVIEQITKKNLTKEQIRSILLKREDFWTLKLNTLSPNGYNDRLNFPGNVPIIN
jgi:hypothetical protein